MKLNNFALISEEQSRISKISIKMFLILYMKINYERTNSNFLEYFGYQIIKKF